MNIAERYPIPPRRLAPADWVPEQWSDIQPLMEELEQRPLSSAEDLHSWLLDLSEVGSLIGGESSRRHAAVSCDTENAQAEERHLDYQTVVLPQVAQVADRLDQKYLASAFRKDLDADHWGVYDRSVERSVAMFRKENVALEAQDEELATEYGKLCGSLTVEYQGKQCTLQEMSQYQENPDRAIREETWRLVGERRLLEQQRFDELFEKMLRLRTQIATNAGYENYRDYRHDAYHRFDYSPSDCEALHVNVKKFVLPAMAEIQARRSRQLGLDTLRPWDLAVDPEGMPSFAPFQGQAEQVVVSEKFLRLVDGQAADDLLWMEQKGLLDLDTRPSKRPGGYMDVFGDVRWPFIFSNSSPTHDGVTTLIHEAGHALHALLARDLEPGDYRESPLEFAEVASMGMEAMCSEHLSAVYPPAEARRARIDTLEGMLSTMPWTCTVDAFQHGLYLQPELDAAGRHALWESTWSQFSASSVDWTGLEPMRATRWHAQLHIFEVPFYYVEYALAQIGAMQLWSRYRNDPSSAVQRYREGLVVGGSKPLPALFEAAGLCFDPRGETLEECVPQVMEAWREAIAEEGRFE
ncbi:MAG: M3 family oligoendopeptidase [Planctomycetes bacterium]|nr:M3 family oligoendopeptidase [Planctomycetota bacterium]